MSELKDDWTKILKIWSVVESETSPWREGMLVYYRFQDMPETDFVGRIVDGQVDGLRIEEEEVMPNPVTFTQPAPDDGGTKGALSDLMRWVWEEPLASAWAYADGSGWEVTVSPGSPLPHTAFGAGSTETEALVDAILAGMDARRKVR